MNDFIRDTNVSNSGILDYLCRYVKRLIIGNTVHGGNVIIEPTDSSGRCSGSLSEAAIKVLADVVVRLGEHLVRTMNSDLGCAGETDAMEIDDDSQEMVDVEGIPETGSKSSSEAMEVFYTLFMYVGIYHHRFKDICPLCFDCNSITSSQNISTLLRLPNSS